MNEELNENLTSTILSFDKEDFWIKKTQNQQLLFTYSSFQKISKKVFGDKQHKYYGVNVSCLTMFERFLFLGNSAGFIRVFDIKSNTEMKPLKYPPLAQQISKDNKKSE